MKQIIEKVEAFTDESFEEMIGDVGKKVAQAVLPSAVATVLTWASRESHAPILVFGGRTYVWNGKSYDSVQLHELVHHTLIRVGAYQSLANDPNFLNSVEKCIGSASSRFETSVNMNPRGLNFQDGVLLMSQTATEWIPKHSPSLVFTYCLPFNYMGDREESNIWDNFIEQIVPDKEYRDYILVSFANAIAGDPMQAQRMMLLMGVGASGKSTLIDAVVEAIGKKNACRVDDLKNLTKDDSRYRIDLANHLLCICGDASGNIGNKDVLKQIVSKEELSGRRLYKEIEYFTPRASLIVASNEIGFTHVLGDSGISRRIDIIQFDHPIAESKRDPQIGGKLAAPAEQRGMILQMIDALIAMQNEHGKMVRPDRLSDALNNLRNDGDSFLSFMGAMGIEPAKEESATTTWVHQDKLFSLYLQYSIANGLMKPAMRTVKGKARSHGVEMKGCQGKKDKLLFNITDKELHQKEFYITF